MPHKTINRQECINLFHQLMRGDEYRVLRLLGESKLGKSHLLTKVFPALARQDYQARYAILDLRNSTQTAIEILHTACSHLGGPVAFPKYHTAHQKWSISPQVQVRGLLAFLSSVHIKSTPEANESKIIRHLTSQFVADLRNLVGSPVLLLFDTIEGANERTRNWLMDTLLVQLSVLAHVRIVIAGCSVPEEHGSYKRICISYELPAIEEEEAYIAFCHEIGVDLVEQSIRDFARGFHYKPGLFVDYVVPTFISKEVNYGQ